MSVKHVRTKKNIDNTARLAKNAQIKATMQQTMDRRKTQICRVFDLKINTNKLNKKQSEHLTRLFLEAKWLRNDCLANGIDNYQPGATVQVKTPDGFETREYKALGSQMKQSVVQQLKSDRKALASKKTKGGKIGKLKFVREVNSVDLKQYKGTYRFVNSSMTRMKIQNVPGYVRVRGAKQIPDGVEFANAKLVRRAEGYHVLATVFLDRNHPYLLKQDRFVEGTVVGVDMGLKTALTCSDGSKVDARIGESDRLKKLQRKLSRQVKGSNNYRKTLEKIRREYLRLSDKRTDVANKAVRGLLWNEVVFIQDENISEWRRKSGFVRGGKTVQQSVLGRVKARLMEHERVVVVPRFVASTQVCPVCGERTKHHPGLRVFVCSSCGFSADRDVNASCNMVRLGVDFVSPVERRFALVEGLTSASNDELSRLSCKSVLLKQEAPTL
jgi:putative transposase